MNSTYLLSAATLLPLTLFSICAEAMVYITPTDAGLYDRSEAIASGRVEAAEADAADPSSATHYRLLVEQTYKGNLPASIDLRVPGAFDARAVGALVVPGAPRMNAGERVLLFLNRRADGAWGVSQLGLGAFHYRAAADGVDALERDLSEAHDAGLKSAGAEPAAQVRNLARFGQWLRARTAGAPASDDYWTAAAAPGITLKFTTEGAPAARWFEFDDGRSVTLYAGSTGQSGLPGGGYSEVQQAIAAWDNDAVSNVRYVYGGMTAASGGLAHSDGINTVLFNDPDGDIGGVFDCVNGGVLAYSGYRSGGVRSFGGANYSVITEVDTVVQNGAGCALSGHGNRDAAELLAHELGHTLGLGHSCGDSGLVACLLGSLLDMATMRPNMHFDGRGAVLASDDRAGIAWLYPATAAGGSGAPPDSSAPSGGSGSGGAAGGGGGGSLGLNSICALLLGAGCAIRRRRSAVAH